MLKDINYSMKTGRLYRELIKCHYSHTCTQSSHPPSQLLNFVIAFPTGHSLNINLDFQP